MSFWAISIVLGCLIATMFKAPWVIAGHLFIFAVAVLKWIIIVGIIFGFLNTTLAYKTFGFTPVSLMCGDRVYRH